MKKLLLAVLIAISSTTCFAKGAICSLTDSRGGTVEKATDLQNLTTKFIVFDGVEGVRVLVSITAAQNAQGPLYINANFAEFPKDGSSSRTTIAGSYDTINVMFEGVAGKFKLNCKAN